MAKKKTKKANSQPQHQSPEKYIRQKARTLPIGKCYITGDWQEQGLAQIVVTRLRPSGNLVVGYYLVDTFCLGVKDAICFSNMTKDEFDNLLKRLGQHNSLKEITYNEAHNIIFGAIAFAEEGGVEPAKEFNLAEYILEEDTDDIPLIEYEFGKEGKHFLVIASQQSDKRYIKTLQKNLGDNFEFLMEDDDNDRNPWSAMMEESDRHPNEPHSYDYPDYPTGPVVKNQYIADELLSEANKNGLTDEVIDRILALPADEAAADISSVILYTIGRTYRAIADDTIGNFTESSIMSGLALLAQIGSPAGLNAVIEILRQSFEFCDYHLGDYAPGLLTWGLYTTGLNNVDAMVVLMNTPGIPTYNRSNLYDALAMIAHHHPERRQEVIDIFRSQLQSMVTRIPELDAADAEAAASLISSVIDITASELKPEIKLLFDADLVDLSICGDYNAVVKEFDRPRKEYIESKFTLPDVHNLLKK